MVLLPFVRPKIVWPSTQKKQKGKENAKPSFEQFRLGLRIQTGRKKKFERQSVKHTKHCSNIKKIIYK